MSFVWSQWSRAALSTLAIVLVMMGTLGIHLHVSDDHAEIAGIGSQWLDVSVDSDGLNNSVDGDEGDEHAYLHSHGASLVADLPLAVNAYLYDAAPSMLRRSVHLMRAPKDFTRDIEPPPNKA